MISRTLFWLLLTGICGSVLAADLQVGKSSPALIAQESDGSMFDLSKERGKIVLVHFWATWCPDCREEMPALDTFYRQHTNQVDVIALSIDQPREAKKVKEIMQPFAYKAAMLGNIKISDFETPDALPVTYVIDRRGILRTMIIPSGNALTEQDFETVVLPLLQEK